MKSMKNYDSAVLKDKNNLYSTNVFLFFYFIFFFWMNYKKLSWKYTNINRLNYYYLILTC